MSFKKSLACCILVLLAIIAISACQKLNGEFEYDAGQSDPFLIMNASLTSGDTSIRVTISQSVPLSYAGDSVFTDFAAEDAIITLYASDIQQGEFYATKGYPGVYRLNYTVHPGNYRIEARVPNWDKAVYCDFEVPEPVLIDTVVQQTMLINDQNILVLNTCFNDPANKPNYYGLRVGNKKEKSWGNSIPFQRKDHYEYDHILSQKELGVSLSDVFYGEEDYSSLPTRFSGESFDGEDYVYKAIVPNQEMTYVNPITGEEGTYAFEFTDSMYVQLISISESMYLREKSEKLYLEAINNRRTPDDLYTNVVNGRGCIQAQSSFTYQYMYGDQVE